MHLITGNRDAYYILSNHTQIDFLSSGYHIAFLALELKQK